MNEIEFQNGKVFINGHEIKSVKRIYIDSGVDDSEITLKFDAHIKNINHEFQSK